MTVLPIVGHRGGWCCHAIRARRRVPVECYFGPLSLRALRLDDSEVTFAFHNAIFVLGFAAFAGGSGNAPRRTAARSARGWCFVRSGVFLTSLLTDASGAVWVLWMSAVLVSGWVTSSR